MIVSETYSIRDAIYYHPATFDSTTTLSLTGIPTNFVATFKLYKPANYGTSWIEIGSDTSNNIFGGCVSGYGHMGTYVRVNNNYVNSNLENYVFSGGTTSDVELKYNNGVITTKANNKTTTCNYTLTGRSYQRITSVDGAKISNLLIMPL